VLIGIGSAIVAYTVRANRAAERSRAQADQAIERLEFSKAIEHLRNYLAERPASPDVHFLLARTLRRDGQFDECANHLEECKRLGYDPEAVRREMMLLELQRSGARGRSTDELIAMVRDPKQSPAPDPVLLETLYRADFVMRNLDRAALWLHIWLEHYPNDWMPHLWRGEIHEKLLRHDRAQADFAQVLESRPDQPQALRGLGQIALSQRTDYVEAESYFRRSLAVAPRHPDARLGLAMCRYGRGDLNDARQLAQGVLDENYTHIGAAMLLGTIEAESGNQDEALRWLRVAEKGGANPQAVCYQLAQVFRRTGQTADADRYERKFTELRDTQRAIDAATRGAQREPNNADRQAEVGRLCLAVGQSDLAAQWFLKALTIDPNHRSSHAALADYFARQTDPRLAGRAEFHRKKASGP